MPQLLSRMDDINWLTPSIADILEQGPAPPGGDGSIREQVAWFQQRFNDNGIPARIVNVRATPSYTLFIVRADNGNGKNDSDISIRRCLAKISEERPGWRVGFIPQLIDIPEAMGILLRTDQHSTLSLRRLLVRSTFRDHASTLAFTAGNTLEQRLIVEDLARIGSLLVVGKDATRTHFVISLLMTLLTLNTPGELRFVLAGESARSYRHLTACPHTLGRILPTPNQAQPLIDGLVKEINRREEWFKKEDVRSIAAYNLVLRDQGKSRVPRLTVIIDSLTDDSWAEAQERWAETIADVAYRGGNVGIHLVATADNLDKLPEAVANALSTRVLTRSTAETLLTNRGTFHNSLLRFIDGAYINGDSIPNPVELPTMYPDEMKRLVEYWKKIDKNRNQENAQQAISGKTGVTEVLKRPTEFDEDHELLEITDEANPLGLPEPIIETRTTVEISLQQAQALATYLGWIGIGPLQDILGMSVEESKKTITVLKTMGIVENSDSHTPRLIRPIQSYGPDYKG
jgi:DNA segregation ATPase FtsK/SpoIIIE-like protein